MTELSELSKNEWFIMKICWSRGKCIAKDVYESTLKEKRWEYQTVKTMLDRLVKKGYLRMEKLGPLCIYEPAVEKSQVEDKAIDSFVETVFDNAIAPIFARFVGKKMMSEEEIASLKKLISEYEGK